MCAEKSILPHLIKVLHRSGSDRSALTWKRDVAVGHGHVSIEADVPTLYSPSNFSAAVCGSLMGIDICNTWPLFYVVFSSLFFAHGYSCLRLVTSAAL